MKLDPILAKATRAAGAKKYEEALKMLEPEEQRYRGSFHYCYLSGVCCLRLGDYTGALEHFRNAHEIKKQNPLPLLGIAVLYFQRGEMGKTVDF